MIRAPFHVFCCLLGTFTPAGQDHPRAKSRGGFSPAPRERQSMPFTPGRIRIFGEFAHNGKELRRLTDE
jgi:hypothetical protein